MGRRQIVAALIALALMGVACGGGDDGDASLDADATEGFAGGARATTTALPLKQLDQGVDVDGKCVKRYSVVDGGTDGAGVRHHFLTITLTKDPKDELELVDEISKGECVKENEAAQTAVVTKLGLDDKAVVDLSYLTSSGRRIVIPRG
jgi:hypothetical protein